MNKETLEEAAENYGWRIKTNSFSDRVKANELAESAKQDFIAGAKWQAEKMYREEELKDLLIKSLTHKNYDFCGSLVTLQGDLRTANFEIWFDYYKKK